MELINCAGLPDFVRFLFFSSFLDSKFSKRERKIERDLNNDRAGLPDFALIFPFPLFCCLCNVP